jgi:hypothetical protein
MLVSTTATTMTNSMTIGFLRRGAEFSMGAIDEKSECPEYDAYVAGMIGCR